MRQTIALVGWTCAAATMILFAACSRPATKITPEAPAEPITPSVASAPTGATEAGQVGFFQNVDGNVSVLSGSGTETPRIGDPLYTPETIQTDAGASCSIQIGSAVLADLEELSSIDIPAVGAKAEPRIVVTKGTVLFSVGPPAENDALEVTGGPGIVATRGADFLVVMSGNSVTVAVGRGSVRLSLAAAGGAAAKPSAPAGRPMVINEGYQVTIPLQGSTNAGNAQLPLEPLSPSFRSLLFKGDKTQIEAVPQPTGEDSPASSAPPTGSSPSQASNESNAGQINSETTAGQSPVAQAAHTASDSTSKNAANSQSAPAAATNTSGRGGAAAETNTSRGGPPPADRTSGNDAAGETAPSDSAHAAAPSGSTQFGPQPPSAPTPPTPPAPPDLSNENSD